MTAGRGLVGAARGAVVWGVGLSLFRDGLQFATMLVLVRLLEPAHYGQFALVTAVLGFATGMGFDNFILHVLQYKDDRRINYNFYFTLGTIIHVTLFLFLNLLAFISTLFRFYHESAHLIHFASVLLLLQIPYNLRKAMIQRSFDWPRLTFLEASGLALASVSGIMLALNGAGAYALVAQTVIITLPLTFDLLVLQRWRPLWSWDRELFIEVWRFGTTVAGGSIVMRGRPLLESAAVVYALGYTGMGILNRASGLAVMFCSRPAVELMGILYPVIARVDPAGDERARVGGLLLRAAVWTMLPIAAALALFAEPLIHLLYGPRWDDVVPILPLAMATAGVLGGIVTVLSQLLLAANQPRARLWTELGLLLGVAVAVPAALPWGLGAYVLAVGVAQAAVVVLLCRWCLRLRLLDRGGLRGAFVPAAVAAAVALPCGAAPALLALGHGIAAAAVGVPLVLGLYLLVLRLAFPDALRELVRHAPGSHRVGRLLGY